MSFVKTGCNFLFMLSIVSFLASCGGSSSSPPPILQNPVNATLTGTVYASSVAGANVVVLNASGSTIAGPVVTAGNGSYSVSVPSSALSSDLIISSTGGTFTDEATGTADIAAGNLAAYVAGGTLTSGSKVHLTPSSSIIADLVKNHGQTLTQATNNFFNAFGYTPNISVAPVALSEALTVTNAAGHLAGVQAAAFSKLTNDPDLGLAPAQQFDLLAAMADDIAGDGKLNGGPTIPGTATSLPTDIMKRFDKAVEATAQNASTATYTVAYANIGMGAKQGKSQFTLTINDSNGPVTGLVASGALSVEPMMHMSSMGHSTPLEPIVENGGGVYTVTVYYLMSTAMSGMAMGHWELKVTIGTGQSAETVSFYPYVDMAMGTVRGTLKGVNDLISAMMGTEKRSYYLFNDGLTGMTGNHTFNLFIAAKESSTNYPPVSVGTTLHDDQSNTWNVNSMIVEVSTDNGTTWPAVTGTGGGHWSINGLTGLTNGQAGTIYVRVTVNGEQKTTDGNAVGAANAYFSFPVTPGM